MMLLHLGHHIHLHYFQHVTHSRVSFQIAVYVDDLCIVAEKPEELISIFKSKYKLKVTGDGKLTHHLGTDYFHDPDGTMVS